MKRTISSILIILIALSLVACSGKKDGPKFLTKEGIAPYQLTESEKYILQAFGMGGSSQIISFNAPKGTASLRVNVYRLGEDDTWKVISAGAMSLNDFKNSDGSTTGTFTMQLKEKYAIDYNISYASGRVSYKSGPIDLNSEKAASMNVFLEDYKEIKLNEEMPVALMMYSNGTSMSSHLLQDYFNPSAFQGMYLVQAVTLTFSDKAL